MRGARARTPAHRALDPAHASPTRPPYPPPPQDRVLIIADSDLRDAPQDVMDRLCDFAALPRANVSALFAPGGGAAARGASPADDALNATFIDTAYPKFERSGWRLDGNYGPMDPALEGRLRAFFAPYNAALFEYLGRTFDWPAA